MSSKTVDVDAVEDTDNLNQKMQIRAINQARNKAREVRNSVYEQLASNASSVKREKYLKAERGGRQMYFEVVKSYAIELAPLIARHNKQLWEKQELIEAVEAHKAPQSGKEVKRIEPSTSSIKVTGLKMLLNTNFPVEMVYEVTYQDSASGEVQQHFKDEWTPEFNHTDNILMRLDNARCDLGIYLHAPNQSDGEYDDFADEGGDNEYY